MRMLHDGGMLTWRLCWAWPRLCRLIQPCGRTGSRSARPAWASRSEFLAGGWRISLTFPRNSSRRPSCCARKGSTPTISRCRWSAPSRPQWPSCGSYQPWKAWLGCESRTCFCEVGGAREVVLGPLEDAGRHVLLASLEFLIALNNTIKYHYEIEKPDQNLPKKLFK